MNPARSYQVHRVIREHLQSLGIVDDRDLEAFLFPALADLPKPGLFKSMDKAIALLLDAVEKDHEILIWGDYDVDGITATALLVLFFRQLGIAAHHYIPNRLTDGYGLNSEILRSFSRSMGETKLLITVDCGIANMSEIREAQAEGFRVIVTDHHQVPGDDLPADATINPKQEDCRFPHKDLAGVTIAFYLASALRTALKNNKNVSTATYDINMKHFLAYVALGTVADLMPLKGINRLLTRGGFEVIASSKSNTITALFNALSISHRDVVSESIAYQVAPAINAAGRLGDSSLPINLLLSTSTEEANKLAADIVNLNQKRKAASRIDQNIAMKRVHQADVEEKKCVVIVDNFNVGILGITASQLVERFRVPALVCCPELRNEENLKGSGRAPAGHNLYRCLTECSSYLLGFGGHEAAAGFSLKAETFTAFKRCFEQSVLHEILKNGPVSKTIEKKYVKLSVSDALDPLLLDNIRRLEPMGEGNPKPVFIDDNTQFVSLSYFGFNREHVRGVVRGKYTNIPFIGFNLGERVKQCDASTSCTFLYSHMLDYYNGRTSWKLKAEDVW